MAQEQPVYHIKALIYLLIFFKNGIQRNIEYKVRP